MFKMISMIFPIADANLTSFPCGLVDRDQIRLDSQASPTKVLRYVIKCTRKAFLSVDT